MALLWQQALQTWHLKEKGLDLVRSKTREAGWLLSSKASGLQVQKLKVNGMSPVLSELSR